MADTPKNNPNAAVEPLKMFDNLYYIGTRGVGIYVIKTSEGLVLIDASACATAYDDIVEPSLKKLGLENEKILALYLTHGHGDHYLGAPQIRERTCCPVYLSSADTAFMNYSVDNKHDDWDRYIPQIEDIIDDDRIVTYGDTEIQVLQAPGHTPGCLNFSFDAIKNGQKYRVLVFGGYGIFGPGNFMGQEWTFGRQRAVDNALTFASTCMRTWEYVQKNNVVLYLNPHPHLCGLFEMAEKAAAGDENAYIMGVDGVRKWILDRFDECLKWAGEYSNMRQEYKEA